MITSLLEEAVTDVSAVADKGYTGFVMAMIGVALCVILCGIGSAIGLYKTGSAAAGVLGEDPKKFGKVLVLVLLPATQGIYGFIIGIIASSTVAVGLTLSQGWALFGAVGKQESLGGKLIIYPAMIEFYAILGLIISIMLVAVV